jgi:lactam utilization protein B
MGALYNMAARNKSLAAAIARAIKDFNPELIPIWFERKLFNQRGKCNGIKNIERSICRQNL